MTSSAPERAAAPATPSDALVEKVVAGLPDQDRARALEDLDALRAGSAGFAWTHAGRSDVLLGDLLGAIRRLVVPPARSGHLGNWREVVRGRAGIVDYNKAICRRSELGFPLLHALMQTEDSALRAGDTIYLPGSILERGKRTTLELHACERGRLRPQSRETPLFVPFVATPVDGDLVPLVELHSSLQASHREYGFELEASKLLEPEAALEAALERILEEAARHPAARSLLSDVASGAVGRDARVGPARLSRTRSGWALAGDGVDVRYATTAALVSALLVPLRAVREPRAFFDSLEDVPPQLPLVSNKVLTVLSAMQRSQAGPAAPYVVHGHWGALQMAGTPPATRGYFAAKSHLRFLRFASVAVAGEDALAPVYFVLLPVAPLTLWPASAFPQDRPRIEALVAAVARVRATTPRHPPSQLAAIEAVARAWADGAGAGLSRYLRSRFSGGLGMLDAVDPPDESDPIEPDGWADLTAREATMLASALTSLGRG